MILEIREVREVLEGEQAGVLSPAWGGRVGKYIFHEQRKEKKY